MQIEVIASHNFLYVRVEGDKAALVWYDYAWNQLKTSDQQM